MTGPIAVQGARSGDLLAVDVLDLQLRCGYGIVSSRHGRGALPEEFPDGAVTSPFCTVQRRDGARRQLGIAEHDRGARTGIALRPASLSRHYGVAPALRERQYSIPPGPFGGNLDLHHLGVGATLYLPVQVQGDGEVALTAFEAPLRATVRLRVIPKRDTPGQFATPDKLFAETAEMLIPIGLHADLDEAMRDCVRSALDLLEARYAVDRPSAYAYLSAAGDFGVSQVVDRVKGIHGLIRKSDFLPAAAMLNLAERGVLQ